MKTRTMRRTQVSLEQIFWEKVRKLDPLLNFIRHKIIFIDYSGGRHIYYADFYCRQKKLVVEIDGHNPDSPKEHDLNREYMERNLGFRIFRIQKENAEQNINRIIQEIRSI
jgi:very-short-patch-repair endonuclease